MLHPGARIGDWEIVLPLGQGGMGSVFRCRHALSERIEAAVKVLKPTEVPGARARFIREAEALHSLRHPAIVRITGFGEDAATGLMFLAMELVHGEDLEQLLQRRAFPRERVAEVFGPVADGLAYAHSRGIVHRDIKPGNLMLQVDGSPVLLDFGIAVQEGQDRLTQEGIVPGTVAYAAPEQVTVGGSGDPTLADLYALGQVLCECLTGTFTFPRSPDMGEHRRSVQILRQKLRMGPLDPGAGFHPRLRELVRSATDPDASRRGPPLAEWAAILSAGPVLAVREPGPGHTDLRAAPLPDPSDEVAVRLRTDESDEPVVIARSLPPNERVIVARSLPPPSPRIPLDAALPDDDDDSDEIELGEAETEVHGGGRFPWGWLAVGLAAVLLIGGSLLLVSVAGGAAAWWSLASRPRPRDVTLGEVLHPEDVAEPAPSDADLGPSPDVPPGPEPAPRASPTAPAAAGRPGQLVVAADVDAAVAVDGAFLRDSPVTRPIPAGRHTVTLTARDGRRKVFTVDVDPDETVRRVWSFGDGEWRSFDGGIDERGRPERPSVGDAEARVRSLPAVSACLQRADRRTPVQLAFVVAPDGSVVADGLSGEQKGSELDACLKAAVRTLDFGPSRAGAAITVSVGG